MRAVMNPVYPKQHRSADLPQGRGPRSLEPVRSGAGREAGAGADRGGAGAGRRPIRLTIGHEVRLNRSSWLSGCAGCNRTPGGGVKIGKIATTPPPTSATALWSRELPLFWACTACKRSEGASGAQWVGWAAKLAGPAGLGGDREFAWAGWVSSHSLVGSTPRVGGRGWLTGVVYAQRVIWPISVMLGRTRARRRGPLDGEGQIRGRRLGSVAWEASGDSGIFEFSGRCAPLVEGRQSAQWLGTSGCTWGVPPDENGNCQYLTGSYTFAPQVHPRYFACTYVSQYCQGSYLTYPS
jgi:hypothetical protein